MDGLRMRDDDSRWRIGRRQLFMFAAMGGCSAALLHSRTSLAQTIRSKKIRLIVNDIHPQFIPSSASFRIVTCKELVSIRNAYVSFTTAEVLQTQEFEEIYKKIKARHAELKQAAGAELVEMQKKLSTASDRERKLAIAAYVPIGLAAIVFIAGILPALGVATGTAAVVSTYLLNGVTFFKAGYGTYQLFRLNESEGVQETVGTIASFNDAKLGTLSFISDGLGDVSSAEQLNRFNAKTWGAVANLFDLYAIAQYFTDDALVRSKGLADLALLNFNALNAEAAIFLASKQSFAEYIRLSSTVAAKSAERIWQAASLNDCAVHGTLALSRTFETRVPGPVLRSKP